MPVVFRMSRLVACKHSDAMQIESSPARSEEIEESNDHEDQPFSGKAAGPERSRPGFYALRDII